MPSTTPASLSAKLTGTSVKPIPTAGYAARERSTGTDEAAGSDRGLGGAEKRGVSPTIISDPHCDRRYCGDIVVPGPAGRSEKLIETVGVSVLIGF